MYEVVIVVVVFEQSTRNHHSSQDIVLSDFHCRNDVLESMNRCRFNSQKDHPCIYEISASDTENVCSLKSITFLQFIHEF